VVACRGRSRRSLDRVSSGYAERQRAAGRTLGVQEVADGYWVGAVGDVRRLEDLLHVRLRLQAHVLLAERGGLLLDVGVFLCMLADTRSHAASAPAAPVMTYKLLRQRHLLQRHAMHASRGAADRGRDEDRRLHVGGQSEGLDAERVSVKGGRM
jgi:hypothetical protein